MIRYRKSQKIFFLPAVAGLLGHATSAIFAGSSLVGMKQGKQSNELMAQQNAEMERANREQQKIEQQRIEQEKKWQEQQLKLQKKALKQGINPFGQVLNTQGQPTTPIQMDSAPPPPIAQMNYSDSRQKDFSIFSFAKDMSLLASRNRGLLINGVLAGAATTAGVYTADKIIRDDKEKRENKSDVDDDQNIKERSFSKRRKISLKTPIFSFALGAVAPAISYTAERKLEEDMIKDTTTLPHEVSTNSPRFREKSFAVPSSATGKVLNAVSIMAGGGGAKGMRKLGIQISAIGKKSGNKATKKLGQAILNNPNASMALSIPGGLAILGGTFTIGDKVATKIAKKVDPEAFKYVESKNEEIE